MLSNKELKRNAAFQEIRNYERQIAVEEIDDAPEKIEEVPTAEKLQLKLLVRAECVRCPWLLA